MTRSLDLIMVVDVESTCWPQGEKPEGQNSEIIEIGVCPISVKLRKTYQARQILIRPQSTVSKFCTDLTGWTNEDLVDAGSYADAVQILTKDLDTKQHVWASYGDYDRKMFEKESSWNHCTYPFGSRHINVKTLFALRFGLQCEVGMDKALHIAGLELKGQHHKGIDDAKNIAQLLIETLA